MSADKGMGGEVAHWTHRLFVDNAHLYLPFLEAARQQAPREVQVLLSQFQQFGVPPKTRVLDVGCGIGRHSVPLAQEGYDVVGFDLSPLFLAKASQAAEEADVTLRLVQGDTRDLSGLLEGEAPFDAVVNMFTSHGYYGHDDDLRFFQALHGLAAPKAVLVVETLNRDFILRNFTPIGIEEAGGIEKRDRRHLNLETSSVESTWTFYERRGEDLTHRLRLELELRMYSLHEITQLLGRAGWRTVNNFTEGPGGQGTYPIAPDSFRMWIVAQRCDKS